MPPIKEMLEWLELYVAEPDGITVILQTDMSTFRDPFPEAGEILELAVLDHLVPLFRPKAILHHLHPVLNVGNFSTVHPDDDPVPLAIGVDTLGIGRQHVVQRSGQVAVDPVVAR